jgi:hypothetical protein
MLDMDSNKLKDKVKHNNIGELLKISDKEMQLLKNIKDYQYDMIIIQIIMH